MCSYITYDKNCINSLLSTSPSSALQTTSVGLFSPFFITRHPFTVCLAEDLKSCCWSCSITWLWVADCDCVGLPSDWAVHEDCCSWLASAGRDRVFTSQASDTSWLDSNTSTDPGSPSPASEFWQDAVCVWQGCPLEPAGQVADEFKQLSLSSTCCRAEVLP